MKTAGQTPARASRFRALWAPLAEENEAAQRQDEPARQTSFSLPVSATPAPPPNDASRVPVGMPAGEGGTAPGSQARLDPASETPPAGLTCLDPGFGANENEPSSLLQAPTGQSAAEAVPAAAAGTLGNAAGQPGTYGASQPAPAGPGARRTNSGRLSPALEEPLVKPLAGLFPAGISWPVMSAASVAPVPNPDSRRSGEVKSSAAEISRGPAGQGAKAAENPSTPSSMPELGDGGNVPAVRSQLAFTGRLVQVAADAETPSQTLIPASPQGHDAHATGSNAGDSGHSVGSADTASVTPVSPTEPAGGDRAGTPGAGSGGLSAFNPPANREADPARSREPPSPSRSAPEVNPSAANPAAHANLSPATQRSEAAGDAPGQPAAARSEREPEPAAPQKLARDITLELDSGSQRVAVRLVERGGEVHVAVRTPDASLAGDLRQALPSLAAKLEQTGFRTETWHPGTTPRHPAEAAAGGAPQDQNNQNGQGSSRERREGQPQPREGEQRPQRKKEGKDFAWFMSSLG